ncbi:MAG: nucleoside phosphorylase [Nitrososphaerota archaeon]|jgi:adenosylhomocysteine nucleosidase|nr:nucleoside phosphorylase [Nitrososphaerota archaeon]MDG6936503.1 nucleoside phosphorylase [Nitrososphaerota archaeon]MDG6944978.1 nucleoside phosphorylase [Nitrososphaerota archaeon]
MMNIKIVAVVFIVLAIIGFSGFAYDQAYVIPSQQSQLNSADASVAAMAQSLSTLTAEFQEINTSLLNLNNGLAGEMATITLLNSTLTAENSKLISLEQNLIETPRIGIVDPVSFEQAPILAMMNVQASVQIDGYTFWLGTIGKHPVVEVRSGEKQFASELATILMDTHFNIVANIMSGIAGSRNPNLNTGDVLIGAFVVNPDAIKYSYNGTQIPYTTEMVTTPNSLINGTIITGYGQTGATPSDASTYGYGPGNNNMSFPYVADLVASAELVKIAEGASGILGSTPTSYVTGNSNATGMTPAQLMVGVISSSAHWTNPVSINGIQNALYQTDAGENEGMGFAYANTQMGIPWIIVRGISNSHFVLNQFHGVLAADRAANVTEYIIEHFNMSAQLYKPATFSMLSPDSNAAIHGYIVGDSATYNMTNITVTQIRYTAQNGTVITIKDPNMSEYSGPN